MTYTHDLEKHVEELQEKLAEAELYISSVKNLHIRLKPSSFAYGTKEIIGYKFMIGRFEVGSICQHNNKSKRWFGNLYVGQRFLELGGGAVYGRGHNTPQEAMNELEQLLSFNPSEA
jgi:hypothetical protein